MPLGFAKLNTLTYPQGGVAPPDPIGTLLYRLDNPNINTTSGSDQYGFDIDMNNSYIVVSAWTEDATGISNIGAVYCYDVTDGTLLWTKTGTQASEQLGRHVRITENYVYASTLYWDQNGYTDVGRVDIWNIADGTLNTSILPTPINDNNIRFAANFAVNNSNDRIAIYEVSSDSIYIYNSSGTKLYTTSNVFGTGSLSAILDGDSNFIIASAEASDVAKIYTWDGTLVSNLTKPTGYVDYGSYVSVGGLGANNWAGVGDDAYNTNEGRISIYDSEDGSLLYNITAPQANTAVFGFQFQIYKDRLIAGVINNDNYGTNDGAAYIFDLTDGSLIYTTYSPNQLSVGYFGRSVAMHEYRYAVSTSNISVTGGALGHVYVFATGN